MKLVRYQTEDGRVPFSQWLDSLKDTKAAVAVLRRLDRASRGNFGDHKFERDGVWK